MAGARYPRAGDRAGIVFAVPRPAADPAARRQRRAAHGAGARPFSWRRLPLVVWVLVGCGVATLGWYGYEHFRAGRLVISFVRHGAAVPDLALTFFPDQLAFAAPSPPPALGSLQLAGPSVTVGRELVPGHAVVRYEGKQIGTGFVHVRLGQPLPPIELHEPKVLEGRVGEPIGVWCFGWRCPGFRPIAGAEVVAMGGGEHGIALATTRTDEQGRFRFADLDVAIAPLGLRVRAAGFAIAHLAVPEGTAQPQPQIVALAATTSLRGKVVVPEGLDVKSLRVLARGLPGVEATPDADGQFTLDHVPPGVEPRLFVHGLGPLLGHAQARAMRGKAVQIDVVAAAVVRGRVVDGTTQSPLGGSLVFCGEGDAVRADDRGRFELTRLLPGAVEITAQWQIESKRRRPVVRTGHHRVQLGPGQVVEDFVVAID